MICSCKNDTGVITPEMAPNQEDVDAAPMTEETDNAVWMAVQNLQANAWNSIRSLYPVKESDSDHGSVDEDAEKSSYTFCGVV